MKLDYIYARIREQIGKRGGNYQGLCLFHLNAQSSKNKGRTIYVSNADRYFFDQIGERLRELCLQDEKFRVRQYFLDDFNELSVSDDSKNEFSVENNWRCRLIEANQINLATEFRELEFRKLFLRSVWRIIIEERVIDGVINYFCRRDIYPTIWIPGYSIPGIEKSNLKKMVSDELQQLVKKNFVDEDFDVIKFFIKKVDQRNFTEVRELSISDNRDLFSTTERFDSFWNEIESLI